MKLHEFKMKRDQTVNIFSNSNDQYNIESHNHE